MQKVRFTTYDVTRDEPVELAGAEAAHVVDARYTMVSQGAKVLVREVNLLVADRGRAPARLLRALARGRLRGGEARRRSSTPSGCDDARRSCSASGRRRAAFFVLAFVAAVLTDSATDTLEQTNNVWLAPVRASPALVAGFLGDRLARPGTGRGRPLRRRGRRARRRSRCCSRSRPARATPQGPWLVLVAVVGAAAIGAHARERIAAAQRRR